jgi:aspartate/methionine/tyrosine aminotransferase
LEWLVGNVAVAKALLQVKSQIDSGMSLPLQELGIEALSHTDHVWHDHMIAEYTRRRNVIGEKLKTLGLVFEQPRAGLYIWAKIPDSAVSAEAFCMDLLEKQQILLTPGSAFGSAGDRYIRASICVNIDSIDAYFK